MIRRATREDIPALMRLLREFAEHEQLGPELKATPDALAAALFGDPVRLHALIATSGQEAAGFAFWFYTFRSFACRANLFVEDVYVGPAWRGRGIGLALFGHLARIAEAEGCRKLEWLVLENNAPARAFYARIGAGNPFGWLPQELSGDALGALASKAISD